MSGIILVPSKSASYTLKMQGTSVPLYTRPVASPKASLFQRITAMVRKSDATMKLSGHMVFILVGLAVAIAEISLGVSPALCAASQFILPNIVQEIYDFIHNL